MPDRNNNNDTSITEDRENIRETQICWRKELCTTTTLGIIGLIQGAALIILLKQHEETLPLVTATSLMLNIILIMSFLEKQKN